MNQISPSTKGYFESIRLERKLMNGGIYINAGAIQFLVTKDCISVACKQAV